VLEGWNQHKMIGKMKIIVVLMILMIIIMLIIIVIISLFYNFNEEDPLVAPSTSYYVDNNGDDSNDGLTPSTPWKTIGKVNSAMLNSIINNGDDIYFNRGDTFDDTYLLMRKCGTASDTMIVGAYGTGSRPIFNGNAYGIHWNVVGSGYIRFENLDINGSASQGISFYKEDTKSVTFANVTVRNSSNNGILLYQINGYTIDNCTVHDCNLGGIVMYGSATYGITNGTVRDSVVYNIGTDGFSVHPSGVSQVGDYHYFINCTGYNCGEDMLDITSGNHILVKDCEGYSNGAGGSSMLIDHGPTNVTVDNYYSHDEPDDGIVLHIGADVIIRNSVIEKFTNHGLYIYGTDSSTLMQNLTFYNNDIITDGDDTLVQVQDDSQYLTFKNNIFYSTDPDDPDMYINYINAPANMSVTYSNWSYNMWWRGDNGAEDDTWWAYDGIDHNLATWNANDEVYNDVRDDPEFADAVGSDFTLNTNSPCIDAGDWLTTTDGGGSGNIITVHEANYFSPGLSTLSVSGDNIFVGDDTNLEITAVDYNAETITVNRSITWADGEAVSLSSYYGSAPDIGAYEYPSNGSELHEFGGADQFKLFCLVIFCFVVMTKKLYIKQTRKSIMSR